MLSNYQFNSQSSKFCRFDFYLFLTLSIQNYAAPRLGTPASITPVMDAYEIIVQVRQHAQKNVIVRQYGTSFKVHAKDLRRADLQMHPGLY